MYNYGLIGNCQIAALISGEASIDWLCLPRPDSAPVFGRLLDPEGGFFAIEPEGDFMANQSYLFHSNILVTEFVNKDGARFRVIDFCPRFLQFSRIFRPISLFRIVEPLHGECRIRIRCRPVHGWSKKSPERARGNAHVRWHMDGDYLRLNTNMSITHLIDESSFNLSKKIYLALTWSSSLHEDLPRMSEDYLIQTERYWDTWVKHCSIPSLFQEETIRSALVLKLHCFEDTGAILAAMTTSLPEEIGGVRNWDYRYCWLRDAYFVLTALNALGHFEEMEDFIRFLLNIVADTDPEKFSLSPVYGLDHQRPGAEVVMNQWSGYQNSRPVRVFNQASEHIQNDVYGEMILALMPIFMDARFVHLRSPEYEHLIEVLLRRCASSIGQADAGPWEIRTGWREHSFSNLACWAGLERGLRLQRLGFLANAGLDMAEEVERARKALDRAVVEGSLRAGPSDRGFDASVLLMPILRYPDHDLNRRTIDQVYSGLQMPDSPPGFLFRYRTNDDFGLPQSPFLVCGFWLVQALARSGRKSVGADILKNLMEAANRVGLYAEHFNPLSRNQSGNFPQTYSHVGQINAAFAVSPDWGEIL